MAIGVATTRTVGTGPVRASATVVVGVAANLHEVRGIVSGGGDVVRAKGGSWGCFYKYRFIL